MTEPLRAIAKECSDLLEFEIRKLRDIVYGRRSTDINWEGCKENWMRPDGIEWLKKHAFPLPDREPKK